MHGTTFVSRVEICRNLVQRNARVSGGTISRAIHELEAHGFLQRVSDCSRGSLYRLRVYADPARMLQVVCHGSRRTGTIVDPALTDQLRDSLRHAGFDSVGQTLMIYIHPEPPWVARR